MIPLPVAWFAVLAWGLFAPFAAQADAAAGTFAGLVTVWSRSRGLTAFSATLRMGMGLLLLAAGGYLISQA